MFNKRGNMLIYAIIISMFAVTLAYIIFTKSEILVSNISYQSYNSKLTRNLEEKAKAALDYDVYLNTNGSGFLDTQSCPTSVSMSGTTISWAFQTISTLPYLKSGILYCSGSTLSGNLLLSFNSDYSTFSSGIYTNTLPLTPPGWTGTLTATFSDPQSTYMSFSVPNSKSWIDAEMNSDNFTAYSTGTTSYPGGSTDDDIIARKTLFGYVWNGVGWYNIFWNNATINAYIEKNTNNIDPYNATIGNTSTGYLMLDLDNPYSIRVTEFDSGAYIESNQLKTLSTLAYTGTTWKIGYIQQDGTLGGTGANAKIFDFKNKNYGIFLSYNGNINNTGATYLKYKLTGINNYWSGIYLSPLDDSSPTFIQFLGSDIIIDNAGAYISKQSEITMPKPGL